MPRGGFRPGAGRKPNSDKHKTTIARAERKIAKTLDELIDLQMTIARGDMVIANAEAARERLNAMCDALEEKYEIKLSQAEREALFVLPFEGCVFTTRPDRRAGQYLIDRIMGKPANKEEIEITIEQARWYVLTFALTVREVLESELDDEGEAGRIITQIEHEFSRSLDAPRGESGTGMGRP